MQIADTTSQTRVQAIVDDFRSQHDIPGLTVAVLRDGRMTTAASGVRDLDNHVPIRADDQMNVGSVTKTFVAGLAMQLVQDGKLDLDAPIGRWLPNASGAQTVTVRELLNHTSGVPNFMASGSWNAALSDGAVHKPFTHEQLLAVTAHAPTNFKPGSPGRGHWEYSNTNYEYLGAILEQVTGQPLEQAIRDRVLHPLHLDGIVVDNGHVSRDGVDHGRSPVTPYWHGLDGQGPLRSAAAMYEPDQTWRTSVWGAAGVVASASQLAQWSHDLIEGSSLLNQHTRAQMQHDALVPPPSDPSRLADGLGVFGGAPLVNGVLSTLWHNGLDLGYSALMMDDPLHHTAIALLGNRDGVGMDEWSQLAGSLFRATSK